MTIAELLLSTSQPALTAFLEDPSLLDLGAIDAAAIELRGTSATTFFSLDRPGRSSRWWRMADVPTG